MRPQVYSIPERLEASYKFTGRGVCIGFVDSGFYPHPDLMRPRRRIKAYADATREDPVAGDFFNPHVWSWHGTMTACCAAGNGWLSGGRYRGLASEADVVLIKAGVEEGGILGKHVAHALRFPLRYPHLNIRILNVSLGVSPKDPDIEDVEAAVDEVVAAGIAVFAAAGNIPGRPPSGPGAAKNAITVGGGNDNNTPGYEDDSIDNEFYEEHTLWPSSSGSPKAGVHKPDLIAPAIWVPAPMLPGTPTGREALPLFQLLSVLEELSTEYGFSETRQVTPPEERASVTALMDAVSKRIARCKYISPDYQHVDGTSFAAPITASVAAQMLEADPSLSPAELREGLCHTARPLTKVDRSLQGAGVVRPKAAVEWTLKRLSKAKGAAKAAK